MNNFLLTGMFRSGTTLLARMLHAHPSIICASDPFATIFKSFRNAVMSDVCDDFDPASPLDDYALTDRKIAAYRRIKNSSLERPFNHRELGELRAKVAHACQPYSPLVSLKVKSLTGNTYAELIHNGLEIVQRAYPKTSASAIGFKEVWTNEFGPHFTALGTQSKVIHLVRDPRAVVASNFATSGRYPLLFLIRQWRKLASISYTHQQNDPTRAMILRYEDLITSPHEMAEAICKFLEIKFDSSMVDTTTFKDGSGMPWRQNTAFVSDAPRTDQTHFNLKTINRWRNELTPDVATLINAFCGHEMRLFSYVCDEPASREKLITLSQAYQESENEMADWIKPFNFANLNLEFRQELDRLRAIATSINATDHTKQQLCLEPLVWSEITSSMHRAPNIQNIKKHRAIK